MILMLKETLRIQQKKKRKKKVKQYIVCAQDNLSQAYDA